MTPVIDAHHHLWQHADIPWLQGPAQPRIFGDYEALRRDYPVEEFLGDLRDTGVVGSVYVQVNWAPGDELREAQWVQSVADATGWPHGIVAYADFNAEESEQTLASLAALPRVRGIRQQLHWHENPAYRFASRPDLMNDAAWRRNFARLGEHGWSFDLQVFSAQMADAARLAADFPDVAMVLQHAGMPEDRSEQGVAAWREGLRRLADQPNVYAKLSGLGTFIHENSPAFIAEIVAVTVEHFGPERCLFGSNFPIEKLWTAYAPVVAAYREALAGFTPDEQHAMLYATAARVYRLDAGQIKPG